MPTTKILPNVCFTCGKGTTKLRSRYQRLFNEDGYSLGDALSETGANRMCCFRHILTDVSVTPDVESELDLDANVRLPAPVPVEQTERTKRTKKTPGKVPSIPHLGGYIPERVLPFEEDSLFITTETPFKEVGKDDLPTPIGWDERSRIMTLVWLLTKTLDERGNVKPDGKRVLWLGSSSISGSTMRFVLDTFQDHFFTLIDWEDMEGDLLKLQKNKKYRERLIVRQEVFSDYMATDLVNHVDVFFSEYGRADRAKPQYELQISTDMRAQLEWYTRIRSRYTLLRLQIPRIGGEFRYAQGVVFVPPWKAPLSSLEFLFLEEVDALKYIGYDYFSEQQRLAYHNRVVRLSAWLHQPMKESVGLDACWECAAESHLWWTFIRKANPSMTASLVIARVHSLSKELSQALDPEGNWTLNTPPGSENVDEEPEEALAATLGKV